MTMFRGQGMTMHIDDTVRRHGTALGLPGRGAGLELETQRATYELRLRLIM